MIKKKAKEKTTGYNLVSIGLVFTNILIVRVVLFLKFS